MNPGRWQNRTRDSMLWLSAPEVHTSLRVFSVSRIVARSRRAAFLAATFLTCHLDLPEKALGGCIHQGMLPLQGRKAGVSTHPSQWQISSHTLVIPRPAVVRLIGQRFLELEVSHRSFVPVQELGQVVGPTVARLRRTCSE